MCIYGISGQFHENPPKNHFDQCTICGKPTSGEYCQYHHALLAEAVEKALKDFHGKQKWIESLRKNMHNHDFVVQLKCDCGMTKKEYLMNHTRDDHGCPLRK